MFIDILISSILLAHPLASLNALVWHHCVCIYEVKRVNLLSFPYFKIIDLVYINLYIL